MTNMVFFSGDPWAVPNSEEERRYFVSKVDLDASTALVLVGPQGCGKSTTVRERFNGYYVIWETARCFDKHGQFFVGEILMEEPDVLVIEEGFPEKVDSQALVKAMISEKELKVEVKGIELLVGKVPKLVFCCQTVPQTVLQDDQRRFEVEYL